MIADLHAHYPMHLMPQDRRQVLKLVLSARGRSRLLDRVRAMLVRIASRFANYRSFSAGPRVTVPLLESGGVGICFSVLYSPFDEMDLALKYGSPPLPRYMPTLLRQLEDVEAEVASKHAGQAQIAHSPAELDAVLAEGKIALVHALEGGFHLGDTPDHIRRAVAELARRGVTYVTLAHLFYRSVATNAPAIPFISDRLYRRLFPQPKGVGLTELGRAAVETMVREHVLVDVSHMNHSALAETFALLDELDPGKTVPLIASHVGYRFGRQEYNLDTAAIERIAERGGVMGVILSEHQAADGLRWRRTRSLDDSLEVLFHHIDRIRDITGSNEHVAIGSDHDGFIKPTLAGLEDSSALAALTSPLAERYGERDAEAILSGNAIRLLRGWWRGAA